MGKVGLPALARMCYEKAQYMAGKLSHLKNISFPFGMDIIKEFTIKINNSAKELKLNALKESIFINTINGDKSDRLIQICVTEKRTRAEIDTLIEFLKT